MRVTQTPVVEHGLYRVVGRRKYRDHDPGEEFEAKLNREAERRAVMRGDIELLRRITPELQPGSYTFPQGWLAQPTRPVQGAPRGALLIEGGK